MIQRGTKRQSLRALMIDDELLSQNAEGRAARALVEELKARSVEVVEAASAQDGLSVIVSDSAIHVILVDWTLDDDKDHARATKLIEFVRARNDKIPIFLMSERSEATAIPIHVMQMVNEFVWTLEDTTAFVGGRVVAAMRRYLEVMLPPMALALMSFNQENEYSWHTPGHTGGTAFLKSPVGRVFYDYFGENLLRSDVSISVGAFGSLLDHTGPIGEHEKYAARVFGAHRTYCVTNGTSTSNRTIFTATVGARSDRALRSQLSQVDRARSRADWRHSHLLRTAAQSVRDHRTHPSRAAQQGSHPGGDQGQSPGGKGHRQTPSLLGRDQFHVRRTVLQRAPRPGTARPERRPDPLR